MDKIKHNLKRSLSFISLSYRLDNNDVIILAYHSINLGHKFSVAPEEFEKQIKYISENFEVISLDRIGLGTTLKKKLIITFDDGYEDNFLYAFPILKKYNITATIFITSNFIFNNLDITKDWIPYNGLKPLQINQIKEMINYGITFGSHGKTHCRLSNLDVNNLKTEIQNSKTDIENALGIKIFLFSYPFGQRKDFNNNCVGLLKESGYTLACSNMWGLNKFGEIDEFCLKRIEINYLDSYKDFVNKIKGKWNFIIFFQKIKSCL